MNEQNGTPTLIGAALGVFLVIFSFPLSGAFRPGLTVVEVEPSDVVFKVEMFQGREQREVRLGADELANAEGLNAKRVVIPHRWVRVRPGIDFLPGVRESRPEQKVFTASSADFRVTQQVTAPTKEGSSFSFELSYNARIVGRGATAEERRISQRRNAAKFIASTVGAVPRNQVHLEVDVAQMLQARAQNIFREALAPLSQQYEQLQIGANKGTILAALEKEASRRIYDEFGVTISGLTYGGTQFPSSTQEKIDANALAPVRKEISTVRAQTEAHRAKKSRLGQQAFTGVRGSEFFIQDQQLDALESWITSMEEAVKQKQVSSPADVLPEATVVTKTR